MPHGWIKSINMKTEDNHDPSWREFVSYKYFANYIQFSPEFSILPGTKLWSQVMTFLMLVMLLDNIDYIATDYAFNMLELVSVLVFI